jgi:hypothetical protein
MSNKARLEKITLKKKIFLLIACCLSATLQITHAQIIATEKVRLYSACPSVQELAVVTGGSVPALLGTPVQQISLLNYSQGRLSPLSFQIDQKDPQGRYLVEETPPGGPQSLSAALDENDELVFRVVDSGNRLPGASEFVRLYSLVEIQVTDLSSGISGWIYASISSQNKPVSSDNVIRYLPDTDSVRSELYHVGFSEQLPFLVDTFHWKLAGNHVWSPDISDTMKIRHRGTFLGFIPFQRTQNDYSSRLVSVKEGPLRIIRRTSNRIRMLWKLKTPTIYVDYVMMPDGFIMDTIIDIPFNIGLFFSNVETLTTMDWNDDPELPKLTIHSPDGVTALPVDGHMSPDKQTFNTANTRHISVSSSFGELFIRLDIPDDFPIQPWLYLRDDIEEPDSPENHAGQFGNVGFRTTEWERIDTKVHHLTFTICMSAAS